MDKETTITYKDLNKLSKKLATKLNKINDDKIIILFDSSVEYLIALFSVWRMGKVCIPVLSNLTPTEIEKIITLTKSQTILTNNIKLTKSLNVKNKIQISFQEINNIQDLCRNEYSLWEDQLAMIVPTSGSTGQAKLVEITYKNIISKCKEIIKNFELKSESETELCLLPVNTLSVLLSQVLPMLMVGGNIFIYKGSYNFNEISKIVEKYKVDYTGLTPTLLKIFIQNENVDWQKFSSLKVLAIGGEMVPNELINTTNKLIGKNIAVPLYGLTETLTTVVGEVNNKKLPINSVGKVYSTIKVKIVDNKGKEVPNGMDGEIIFKGSSISDKYHNNEFLNKKSFKDGWFYTGDIGKLDHHNFLYIKGRRKNIIISSGNNIYPEEIEEVLNSHPNVSNSVVLGSKDDVHGEIPIAKIIVKSAENHDPKELYTYLRERLASYKIPKKLDIVKEFKLKGFGKKERNE